MKLPDTIPCALGGLQAPNPEPTPGTGFEFVVFSHAGYWLPVQYLSKYTSISFTRLLGDDGSGTVTIPMDDPDLFPDSVRSLNANPNFTGGSLTGWAATNGSQAPDSTHTLYQGTSLKWTPDGSHASGYSAETGALFPVIPGQQYTVTAQGFSVAGWNHVNLGMVFFQPDGVTQVGSALVSDLALPAATWEGLEAIVTAPDGAFLGAPCAGSSGSPAGSDVLWFQSVIASYESGAVTQGDYLLDYEHMIQARLDGKPVFEWLCETVSEQIDDDSEQRVATISGPGTAAMLKWAMAAPPGFPASIFKTDSILDGFAEIDQNGNPALDQSLWNLATPTANITLSPLGTVRLAATEPATYLGTSTFDITSSSVSAQVGVVGPVQAGGVLDGSQLTQFYVVDVNDSANYALIGLSSTDFYCRLGDVAAGADQIRILAPYDSQNNQSWRISEQSGDFIFWSSNDGQNWIPLWTVPHLWDANEIAFFFTATYDTNSQAAASMTGLNQEIITPTSAGNIFLDKPIMYVDDQLLKQAQARGTIPWIARRWNGDHDSAGNPWTDGNSVQIANGTNLKDLAVSHTAMINADWRMDPGFDLQVALQVQGEFGVGIGEDKSTIWILREAKDVSSRNRVRARDSVANSVGAVNSDGRVVGINDTQSIARYNKREGWVQTAQSVNPAAMEVVVTASVDQTKDETLTASVQYILNAPGAPVPFRDIDVGDWIGLELPRGRSVVEKVRVIGIAISIDSGGVITVELTIYTYRQYVQQQLQYLVNKFGAQFIYSLGTTPVTFSTANPGTPPTYISPTLTGLTDVSLS
jgi:hypothetical protein